VQVYDGTSFVAAIKGTLFVAYNQKHEGNKLATPLGKSVFSRSALQLKAKPEAVIETRTDLSPFLSFRKEPLYADRRNERGNRYCAAAVTRVCTQVYCDSLKAMIILRYESSG
jgi:hypothetical protein